MSVTIVKSGGETTSGSSSSGSSSSGSSSSSGNESSSSSSSPETSEGEEPIKYNTLNEGYQIIHGIAAFKEDKLVGWLSETESTGLGWITNKNMTPHVDVSLSSDNELKNMLSFSVAKCKSDIKAAMENENPVITVNTKIEANLLKYADNIDFDSLTPDVIALMEEHLAEQVKSDIEATIEKGQKDLKTDIFGFGFAFSRSNYSLWNSKYENEWDSLFPEIQIHVNVTAKIVNTGTNVKKFNIS